ncbi:hypothetical protein [Fretibacter rubidus]|uniref:hypothetical protein n=1 Tax=Fretibacter rubidus TaxID=570162 RepID=UPI00352A42F1
MERGHVLQHLNYHSHMYGLSVRSDIALPELNQGRLGSAEYITISAVPNLGALENGRIINPYCQATDVEIRLNIPDKLTLSIVGGAHIYYQAAPGVDEATLRLYILGSGFGALLQQRGYLVLHGNAVKMTDGGGLICVGPSGIGKSTTAAAMMQRGYKIIADDVCPITTAGIVIPGMPRIKLWEDAAAHLSVSTDGLRHIMPGMAKYNLPLGEAYATGGLKVKTLVELDTHEGADIIVEPVMGVEKFMLLKRNSYRYEYLLAMNSAADHFKKAEHFIAGLSMYKVKRPKDGFAIDRLLDRLINLYDESDIAGLGAAKL